jgi:hypothetical protein
VDSVAHNARILIVLASTSFIVVTGLIIVDRAVHMLAPELPARLEPFADDTIVFVPTDTAAVGPQIEIATAERDGGLTTGAALTIGGNRPGKTRHVRNFLIETA